MAKIVQLDETDDSVFHTNDKCLVLNTNEAINRPMKLPPVWSEIRLGMFISTCSGASTVGGLPKAQEVVVALTTMGSDTSEKRYAFGVKTNDNIMPLKEGSKFAGIMNQGDMTKVGLGTQSSTNVWPVIISPNVYTSSRWFWWINGTEKNTNGYQNQFPFFTLRAGPDSANTSNLKTAIVFHGVKLSLKSGSTSGTYDLTGTKFAESTLIDPTKGEQDVSNTALRLRLQEMGAAPGQYSTTISGAFTEFPSDLTNFFFRCPFVNTRIRVHNYGYMVL